MTICHILVVYLGGIRNWWNSFLQSTLHLSQNPLLLHTFLLCTLHEHFPFTHCGDPITPDNLTKSSALIYKLPVMSQQPEMSATNDKYYFVHVITDSIIFWSMSIFDYSRGVWVLPKKRDYQKIKVSWIILRQFFCIWLGIWCTWVVLSINLGHLTVWQFLIGDMEHFILEFFFVKFEPKTPQDI